jgi:hypothetical protein
MVATRTREYETIYQFVCRCAVRDPNSAEDLVVNVYDRQQAEYLHELFLDSGYVDATLELVDLGFGGTPPTPSKKRGPKAKAKTKSEIAADQQRFREQARARKQKQRARKRGVDLPPF